LLKSLLEIATICAVANIAAQERDALAVVSVTATPVAAAAATRG